MFFSGSQKQDSQSLAVTDQLLLWSMWAVSMAILSDSAVGSGLVRIDTFLCGYIY